MARGMNASPIGVFDSGVGGLSVLKELIRTLPNENIIYLGDTARAPYGSKSKDTITQYALEDADFLAKRGAKALVIACHTISALAITELRQQVGVPIIGMVVPSLNANRVGAIATEATIESGVYRQIEQTIACPTFVPLVENDLPAQEAVNQQLAKLKGKLDALVLACTHFAFLKAEIHQCLGRATPVIDPARLVAQQVKWELSERNLLNDSMGGRRLCYFTGAQDRAKQLIKKLNLTIEEVHPCVLS